MRKKYMRIGLKSATVAVALALNSLTAGAAGLGRINVISALGQPLKAEVDISASRDETPTLAARLAPAEAFKLQGIPYSAALSGIRMSVDKRPSGQPFVRISGDRPLNEPFLEILVELSWGSGRLVREYTFLLDPPADISPKVVATPVAPPEMKAEAKVESKPAADESARKPTPAAAMAEKAKPAAKKEAEGGEREVKRGDTLGKIAAEMKPDGVNLDQMLVALFRSNKDAFDGENMNRLRAGKILKTPEPGDVLAVDAAEARKLVVAQSADFNAYRKKLAGAVAEAPAKAEAPQQAVAGKITPKVEDKVPVAAAGKDKLEVSRTEAAKGAKARIGALEEDLVARDRALKEANSRIADLEKNLSDLKKLAELKSQSGAQLQAQAAKPAVPEAKKPEPAPVAAVKPAEDLKPAEKAAEPAKAAETAKPVEPAKTAEAAKPAAKPAAKKPLPPPPPEPSFMEEYGDMLLMGGAALVTALLGFLGFTAMRKKRLAKAADGESPLTGTDLSANSVFGATGGQSVDTGAALHTDFGQAAGAHDEGVDPVAEADVYMAYGRDAQAEEILIEALKKEPSRHTIHVKLLEIYSARQSAMQFETLAADLKAQTGGSGADWEKAAAMGRTLDPSNPLYAPAGSEPAPAETASATPVASPQSSAENMASTVIVTPGLSEKMQSTVTMPGQLSQMAAAADANPPADEGASLDFDLDLGGPAEEPAAAATPVVEAAGAAAPAAMDFDLDLGGPAAPAEPAVEPTAEPAVEPAGGLDIDFAMDMEPPAEPAPAQSAEPAPEPAATPAEDGGLDFDFGDDDTPVPPAAVPTAEPATPAMDISSISLDLDEPTAAPVATTDASADVSTDAPAAETVAPPAEDNPEVATKLELAQAYEEMGDKDGARELFQEALNEGSAAQQELARARLAKLV